MTNQETFEPEIIDNDFSPLDAPVKQRSYTSHKVDSTQPMPELEVPTYETPMYTSFDEPEAETKEEPKPFNEAYSQLDGKEKAMGAEMMAEMTLDIYEKGCGFLGKLPEISEDKLDRLIAEGEIDADIQIPTEGGDVPVKEFATEYNDSIKVAFEVSDDFKEKVRPPLIRVFKKRGIGMTDEQLLAYYFVTDLGTKGVQAFMLKKTANNILNSLKENTIALRQSRAPRPKQTYQDRSEWDTASKPRNINETDVEPIENENIGDIISEKPKTKSSKPKTNLEEQIEHFGEPEEAGVFANLKDNGGFKEKSNDPDGMPEFGNTDILAELERLSGQDEPKKPVRKTRATKTPTRKPRTKK
jgi:hypothetical protein